MRKIHLLLLLVTMLVGCKSYTPIRHSRDYQAIIQNESSALVLPAEARVYEVEFSGNKKRLYDFEYNIENIIAEHIIEALSKQGLRAKALTRKEIHEQNLHQDLARLEDNYLESEKRIYHKALLEKELAFAIEDNIGDAAKNIALKKNVKLVVLVKYARAIKSSGSQAVNLMTGLLLGAHTTTPPDVAVLAITIVQAHDGKILWSNRLTHNQGTFFSSDNKNAEIKIMKNLLDLLLKPLNEEQK